MKVVDLITGFYEMNLGMLKMTIADFSEEDMFVRPCETANHAMWQLGHLICSESNMINGVSPGKSQGIPEGFAEKFTKEKSKEDSRSAFPTKAELMAVIDAVRQSSIAWARTLTEEDFAKPGPESMRAFIPTVGTLALLIPDHLAMHIGQLQVIRRKLGKPHVM